MKNILRYFLKKKNKKNQTTKTYWKPMKKAAKTISRVVNPHFCRRNPSLETVIVLSHFDEKALQVHFNSWDRSFLEKQELSVFPWGAGCGIILLSTACDLLESPGGSLGGDSSKLIRSLVALHM